MRRAFWLILTLPLILAAAPQAPAPQFGLLESLDAVRSGLNRGVVLAGRGELDAARSEITRVYLDHYEVIEGYYGPAGAHATKLLSEKIAGVESTFHKLMTASDARDFERIASGITASVAELRTLSERADVPLHPVPVTAGAVNAPPVGQLKTPELKPYGEILAAAQAALTAGDYTRALRNVEQVYLQGFEPLESRLPGDIVTRVERIVHLELRPALKSRAAHADASLLSLRAELAQADAFLAQGGSFWFGAVNSLAIILREGLEAVLLVAALLAYLSAAGAHRRERVRIWLGVAGGIGASVVTWILAVTLLPISGASRELVEGITALTAVVVLLYVSHWLFQKTYIHDWKEYLRTHLGGALTRGSAAAMMGLAFAAVYREGFETVLFYQALAFDVGGRAVLAGFLPGFAIISLVGWMIIRAGTKLPLKRVFAITNTVLVYLAFVFLGKGIFNLQESGAFAAHPIAWLPSHPALQQLLGFYPIVETVVAQLALAGLLGIALVVLRMKVARQNAERAAQPALAA